jgi:hypothetical protein
MPGSTVLSSTVGANYVSESPLAAPNVNPYEAGSPSRIYTGGDANPAGSDDVAATVAAAVAAAEARAGKHQQDTYGQGSMVGDLMTFPAQSVDPGVGPGMPEAAGAYYTPPRDYEERHP